MEEVTGGKGRVRFAELPAALHGDDPRFAWPVRAWEQYRLDPHRNPYFERGDGAYFLARRLGRPVGRITAHLDEPGGRGRFGFWAVSDDAGAAGALLDAAQSWLDERGCRTMEGPTSFTEAQEQGVLVAGFDVAGTTGRPWHPPSEAAQLEHAGLVRAGEQPRWRLAAADFDVTRPCVDEAPGQAGRHGDPRLVLEGIAAVPDLSGALRGANLRSAWRLARRVRERAWTTATVVRVDDEPAEVVPALLTAAARAGYDAVIAPWSPDPAAPPETVHATYRRSW